MTWSIEGTYRKLSFHVDDNGLWSISGTALRHNAYLVAGDVDNEFFASLSERECAWSVHSCAMQEHELALYGNELLQKVQENPNKTHGVLNYYEKELAIGFAVFLPDAVLVEVKQLFEIVLLNESLKYIIDIYFDGFCEAGREINIPTIKAFKSGKGYHFGEASFSMLRESNA